MEIKDIILFYDKDLNKATVVSSLRSHTATLVRRQSRGALKGVSKESKAYLMDSRADKDFYIEQMVRVWARRISDKGVIVTNYTNDCMESKGFVNHMGYKYNKENTKYKSRYKTINNLIKEEEELSDFDDRVKFKKRPKGSLNYLNFNQYY